MHATFIGGHSRKFMLYWLGIKLFTLILLNCLNLISLSLIWPHEVFQWGSNPVIKWIVRAESDCAFKIHAKKCVEMVWRRLASFTISFVAQLAERKLKSQSFSYFMQKCFCRLLTSLTQWSIQVRLLIVNLTMKQWSEGRGIKTLRRRFFFNNESIYYDFDSKCSCAEDMPNNLSNIMKCAIFSQNAQFTWLRVLQENSMSVKLFKRLKTE